MGQRVGLSIVSGAVLLVAVGCGSSSSPKTSSPSAATPTTQVPATFADVVAQVKSGVIRIESTDCNGAGVGTGILIGNRLIATVEHVVEGASAITFKRDGKLLGHGTVIGSDASRDVALIRSDRPISGYHFQFASRAPQLGEDVAAIGFPLGLPLTVTRGSVSGVDRTIPIDGVKRNRLVQTDAQVNPGNSGGPLMTDAGEVVGLVDLGTTRANGLAFAVSSLVAGPIISGWSAAPQPLPLANCGTAGIGQAAAPNTGGTQVSDPASYVNQIDSLLQQSHQVLVQLQAFVPAVENGSISPAAAVSLASAFVDARRSALAAAQSLNAPPGFVQAQEQLVRSLELSISDDQALYFWAVDRLNGSSAASADFNRANQLGAQATAAKQQFLAVYGAQRQAAVGLDPSTLPTSY